MTNRVKIAVIRRQISRLRKRVQRAHRDYLELTAEYEKGGAGRPSQERVTNARETWRKLRDRLNTKRERLRQLRNVNAPAKAIGWARDQIGTTESPPYSNRGPEIDRWQQAFGMIGESWCGAFAGYALRVAGLPVDDWIVYVPSILNRAKGNVDGWSYHPPGDGQPGDLAIYGNGPDHVELYAGNGEDIGGNTSSGGAGSQSNGGGVYSRRRDMSGGGGFPLRGFARPPWGQAG